MTRGGQSPGSLFVNLLGGFSVAAPGPENLLTLERRKSLALLAVLALDPGRMVPRGKLASLLWDERSEDGARQGLRQCLLDLRHTLTRVDIDAIRVEGDLIGLNPSKVVVDAARFERHVTQDKPQELEEAVALYRGDLLEGFALAERTFEDWLSAERERLRSRVVGALRALLSHYTRERAANASVRIATRLLVLEPFDEGVHRALMRAYAETGRRSAALRQYEACVELLGRELGVEPEAETRELYRRLIAERPRSTSPSTPARATRKTGVGSSTLRLAFSPPAGPHLCGRQDEIRWLDGLREAAHRGQPQLALVIGEAGIGKSRLVSEVASRAQRRRAQILIGRAREGEHVLAFAPWVEALRPALGGSLAERLAPVTRHDLARLFPEIADGQVPPPTGIEDGPRVFEAVAHVLRDLAASHPLVVVIEDLHWSDDMTLRLLRFLPRRLDGQPVLLVGTVRPEEITRGGDRGVLLEALQRDASCAPRTLGPLSREESTQLFCALLSSREGLPSTLADRVWNLSEGNPFVVVECGRAVRERAAAGATLELPEQVRALTARSFVGLSERAARLTDLAAVIGRDFEVVVLRHAASLTEPEVADGVEEMVRCRVLREVDGKFDFSHDRVREAAYVRLLAPRRALLHRQVAQSLEVVYAEELDRHCAAIGVHYHQAGVWPQACEYLAQAGFEAWARGASREALACFEPALQALKRSPETPERREVGVRMYLAAHAALVASGRFNRGVALLREAESLAEKLPDYRWSGRVAAALGQAYRFAGAHDNARVHGQRALELARSTEDRRLECEARLVLGQAEHFSANFRQALEHLALILDDDTGASTVAYLPALKPMARYCMALAYSCIGEFDSAIHQVQELFRDDEIQAHPFGTPRLLGFLGLGFMHIKAGNNDDVLRAYESARALYREDCHRPWHPLILSAVGRSQVKAGLVAEGLELLEQGDALSREIGLTSGRAGRLNLTAEGLMYAGKLDDSVRMASEALEVARHGEHAPNAASEAHWLLGEALRRRDDACEPAVRHFRDALTGAEALEMRPLAARCHLRLAWLYKRTDVAKRKHHCTAARALLEQLGPHFKLDATDKEALA